MKLKAEPEVEIRDQNHRLTKRLGRNEARRNGLDEQARQTAMKPYRALSGTDRGSGVFHFLTSIVLGVPGWLLMGLVAD